jgi:hypothetical protein
MSILCITTLTSNVLFLIHFERHHFGLPMQLKFALWPYTNYETREQRRKVEICLNWQVVARVWMLSHL